jgi:fatty acid-binding protein 3
LLLFILISAHFCRFIFLDFSYKPNHQNLIKMCDTILGDWKLDSSENFEELMKELGVGLILRKVGATTKPNVKFEKDGDEYVCTTTSAIKTHVIRFKLNEEFPEETMDGRKVLTTFTMDGNKLVQVQKDTKNNNVSCTITREITSDGVMKTVAKAGNVESVRVYNITK